MNKSMNEQMNRYLVKCNQLGEAFPDTPQVIIPTNLFLWHFVHSTTIALITQCCLSPLLGWEFLQGKVSSTLHIHNLAVSDNAVILTE